MELARARLRTEWDLTSSPADLASRYTEESELTLGELRGNGYEMLLPLRARDRDHGHHQCDRQ